MPPLEAGGRQRSYNRRCAGHLVYADTFNLAHGVACRRWPPAALDYSLNMELELGWIAVGFG
jgi:hypothetical protein